MSSFEQAYVLGEVEAALRMRLKELSPSERSSESERKMFFMNNVPPAGWDETVNYVETFVPEVSKTVIEHIDLAPYEPHPEIVERRLRAFESGFVPTHQGLSHPEYGQLDLSIPDDKQPYIAFAREALAKQSVPTQRLFYKDGEWFLLWEILRSPDMPADTPLITEIVLRIPSCMAALKAREIFPLRIPPTAETFAYHQIFIMLERLYADWSNQDELLQEIAMNVLALRDLEARGLPRAFWLAHAMQE